VGEWVGDSGDERGVIKSGWHQGSCPLPTAHSHSPLPPHLQPAKKLLLPSHFSPDRRRFSGFTPWLGLGSATDTGTIVWKQGGQEIRR